MEEEYCLELILNNDVQGALSEIKEKERPSFIK